MKKIYLSAFIITLIFLAGLRPASAAVNNSFDTGIVTPGIVEPINNISSQLMNFVNGLNTHTSWRGGSVLARGSYGNAFEDLVNNLSMFGFMDNNVAQTAESFGPATTASVRSLQTIFGVQPGDTFDVPTQTQFASFIDSFVRAEQALPGNNIVPTAFFIVFPSGDLSRFDPISDNFTFNFDQNNPGPALRPFFQCDPGYINGHYHINCRFSIFRTQSGGVFPTRQMSCPEIEDFCNDICGGGNIESCNSCYSLFISKGCSFRSSSSFQPGGTNEGAQGVGNLQTN